MRENVFVFRRLPAEEFKVSLTLKWSHTHTHTQTKCGNRLSCSEMVRMVNSLVAQTVKCLPTMWETQVRSLGREDPLEKEMATHSSNLAWKIPRRRSLIGSSPWGRKELDTNE